MNDKETDDNGFVPVDGGDVHWLDQEDMGSLLDMRLKLVDGDPRDEHGQDRSCVLLSMEGNDGYLGKGNKGKKVLWADGLLGVTTGHTKKSGFTGSVRSSSYSTNIMWEAKPSSSIPVLKDFVVRYNDYRKLFDEVKHLSAAMTDDWTVDHLMKYAEGIASLLYKPEELDVLLSVDENEDNETAEEDQRRLRLRHTVEPFVGLNDRKQEWLAQYNKELVSKEFLAAEIQLCRSAAELHLRRNRWFFEWMVNAPPPPNKKEFLPIMIMIFAGQHTVVHVYYVHILLLFIYLFIRCVISVSVVGMENVIRLVVVSVLVVVYAVADEKTTGSTITLQRATAVCHIARKLKGVSTYVAQKLEEYDQKIQEIQMMRDVVRLKVFMPGGEKLNCGKESAFLLYVYERLAAMQEVMGKLRQAGTKAAGSAGIAAGRLDEFVSVFKQAAGEPSDRNFLNTCYKGSGSQNIFYGIGDDTDTQFGDGVKNLGEYIDAQFTLSGTGTGGSSSNSETLAHVKNSKAYVDEHAIVHGMPWGDGIFTVQGGDQGEWKAVPSKDVTVLRSAAEDYQVFVSLLKSIHSIYAVIKADWVKNKLVSDNTIRNVLYTIKTTEGQKRRVSDEDDNSPEGPPWFPTWNPSNMRNKLLEDELTLCEEHKRSGTAVVSILLPLFLCFIVFA
ncbi:Transferrin receptor-like, PAG-like [Trypanosoma congolense IL3000]|uniref:Transferrin receptor-like, PAG-like n=1 Tax=Trypanosoma congolense (strain IL3000) TaxID=1068625 RepID=F9W463_TRYCI|nr:Transferrin receptor-like, PAG-like [Trypanosoma congolense IL3000]